MSKQYGDVEWNLESEGGGVGTWEKVSIAVLMDIRRELRRLNSVLACPNFQAIPKILRRVSSNTAKPRKRSSKRKR